VTAARHRAWPKSPQGHPQQDWAGSGSQSPVLGRDEWLQIQHLTHDQVAEWRACSAEMLAEYMEANGELAQRLMAAYGKLRTDPCCTTGPGSEMAFTRR
jgi:hypothetical protein